MANENIIGTQKGNNSSGKQPLLSNNLRAVRVLDIILDSTHPEFENYGAYDSIGMIFWGDTEINKSNKQPNTEYSARPLNHFLKQYPLKNEIVLLITAPSNIRVSPNHKHGENEGTRKYYLPSINIWNHPHNNALPDMRYYNSDEVKSNFSTIDGQVIRTPDDNSVEVPLGNYFKEQLQIQPLLPFEGDTIFEGRFGNSIRFGATAIEKEEFPEEQSAYSTKGNTGDPITIIRNGALVEEDDNGWEHTLENINDDHSTIYLTSNQILPNLKIVAENWDSWLGKHDTLDVGDAEDEFDNIFRGPEPDVIEIEKETDEGEGNKESEQEALEEVTEDKNEEFPVEEDPTTFKYGFNEDNRTDITLDAQNEEPGEWDPGAENQNK